MKDAIVIEDSEKFVESHVPDLDNRLMSYNTQYRLMTYFAVSTFMFYSKDIDVRADMQPNEFRDKNPELIERIFAEGISIFNYELSYGQIDTAILAYIAGRFRPESVHETETFISKHKFTFSSKRKLVTINLQDTILICKGKQPVFTIHPDVDTINFNVDLINQTKDTDIILSVARILKFPRWKRIIINIVLNIIFPFNKKQ